MAKSPARTGALVARLHTDGAELRPLRDEWDALLARSRCGSAFLGSDWLAAAFENVEEPGTRLHVITVRTDGGDLVGFAPFCVRRGAPWMPRVLEFLGTRRVSSEYLDIVCDPEFESEVIEAIWNLLREGPRAWDYVRLSDADASSVVMTGFVERMPPDRFRHEIEAGQTCPYLPLPETQEALQQGLSARFRSTLRRAERKMAELDVRLVVAEGAAALGPALDRLYDLHALRWGRRGQTGKLHHASIQRFHRAVAERLGPAGRARVYSLQLRGVTIAALYGLEYKGRFFFYQSGFDPTPPDGSIAAWDYSPGAWIVNAAIRDSVRRGLREFDFLRGSEVYKTRWTPSARETSTLVVLPTDRWRGRAHHRLDSGIRRAKRQVRSWLGRRGRGAPATTPAAKPKASAAPGAPREGNAHRQGFHVDWLRDLPSIEALEPIWHSLEEVNPERSVFLEYDYLIPWYRHQSAGYGAPLVGVVERNGTPVGIAPLACWRGTIGKVPVRRIDSAAHNCQVGGFLHADGEEASIGPVVAAMRKGWNADLICLHGLDPDGSVAACAAEEAKLQGYLLERTEHAYAVVDLANGYEGYSAGMSRNFRRTAKRQAERAEALGRVAVERIPRGASEREVGEMLRRAFAIADRSWKAAADGPMAAMFRDFYEEVAQRFHRRGMFDLSILKIDDRDIAYLYALREGATFYDGTVSFDDEYRDISPGAHLLQEVLRRLPAEGVTTVVSHGDHEYKRRWATAFVPQCRLFLFEHSLRGWLGHVARFTLPRLAPTAARSAAGKTGTGSPTGHEASV